jgi:hypothetical protein
VNTFHDIPNQVPYSFLVCGVPSSGVPIATALSLYYSYPQIYLRKETKDHGLKHLIEGEWAVGDKVLLVDDVCTTGKSMMAAKKTLTKLGLNIIDCIVVVKRNIGIAKDVKYLVGESEVMNSPYFKFRKYLRSPKGCADLCLAADVDNIDSLIDICSQLKNEVVMIKLHPDIIKDWDPETFKCNCPDKLLIWADLKFCDVPHILERKLRNISSWAKAVSVMSILNEETFKRLDVLAMELGIMIFVINQLWTEGKIIWDDKDDSKDYSIYPSVVASVGRTIPGLHHIRAEVGECLDAKCDVLVRERRLIEGGFFIE